MLKVYVSIVTGLSIFKLFDIFNDYCYFIILLTY